MLAALEPLDELKVSVVCGQEHQRIGVDCKSFFDLAWPQGWCAHATSAYIADVEPGGGTCVAALRGTIVEAVAVSAPRGRLTAAWVGAGKGGFVCLSVYMPSGGPFGDEG